jgi:hypothetical protein
MRNQIIGASRLHFKAHIEKHRINIEVMLSNPTAIHDHADLMDAIEKEIAFMAEYEDKLQILDSYFTD